MGYLDRIITEEINKILITEITSSRCYHFCGWDSLKKILRNNQFALRTNITSRSEHWNQPNKRFYMSLTRNGDGRVGYQSYLDNEEVICRIELDGDKLNDNYRIRPVNWVANGDYDTIEKRAKSEANGKVTSKERYTKMGKINGGIPYCAKVQDEVENEDRIFSNKPIIPNAYSYIKRIDVLINDTSKYARGYMTKDEIINNRNYYLSNLLKEIDVNWLDKMHFYESMPNFNARKNELQISKPTENSKEYEKALKNVKTNNQSKWMDLHAKTLAQGIGCIGQMIDVINSDDFKLAGHYAKYWVDKYNLSELIDNIPDSAELDSRLITLLREKNIQRVDEAVNAFWHILEQMEESVRTLNKNAPNNIYVMRILKMITDFVISTGCDTIATSTQKSYGKSIFQLLKDKLEKKYIANHG